MGQEEDRTVVARVLAGDREAFRVLVDRHAPALHRYCRTVLRHREDAEDAAQETFLKAYGALACYDARLALSNWLFAIAANVCRDRLRRRRRPPHLVSAGRIPEVAAAAVPAGPAPDPSADPAVLTAIVLEAAELLKPEYREVFHLYHRENRSLAEIAVILDRPVGTVKTHLHRARRRLVELVRGRLARPPELAVGRTEAPHDLLL